MVKCDGEEDLSLYRQLLDKLLMLFYILSAGEDSIHSSINAPCRSSSL